MLLFQNTDNSGKLDLAPKTDADFRSLGTNIPALRINLETLCKFRVFLEDRLQLLASISETPSDQTDSSTSHTEQPPKYAKLVHKIQMCTFDLSSRYLAAGALPWNTKYFDLIEEFIRSDPGTFVPRIWA